MNFLRLVLLLSASTNALNAATPAPIDPSDGVYIFTVVLGDSEDARRLAREKNAILLPSENETKGLVCSLASAFLLRQETKYYDISVSTPALQGKTVINVIHCDWGFAVGIVDGILVIQEDEAEVASATKAVLSKLRRK